MVVQVQDGAVLEQNNQYGLKPYIYYTCRYKDNSPVNPFDFVVNYTLDNAIVIYGYIGSLGYKTVSGYLVGSGNSADTTDERLEEYILVLDNNELVNYAESDEYEYYYSNNGTKIYKDHKTPGTFDNNLFLYKNNKRVGTGTLDTTELNSPEEYNKSYDGGFKEVVEKIKSEAAGIVPVDEEGVAIPVDEVGFTGFNIIFDIANNPENYSSDFNEHKRAIIKRSIKSNLYTAMANFSRNSLGSYEFRMPEIDETEWDKVVSNVGVISFMQGIPMGNKYYNDYCIVSNNNNKEYVSEDSIYILDTGENIYHRVGCSELDVDVDTYEAYLNIDFRRQTVKGKIDEDVDGNPIADPADYEEKNYYYYPQRAQACYKCIVSQSELIDRLNDINFRTTKLGEIFYRALAREKYNLYKVNDYLNDA